MRKYVCVANCPELDDENTKHCSKSIDSEEAYSEMLDWECPCGNNLKWQEVTAHNN